jgi:hypothetical protein
MNNSVMHLYEMKFKENQQQYQLHNTIFLFSNTKESYVSLCEEEERYKKSIQQPHTHHIPEKYIITLAL